MFCFKAAIPKAKRVKQNHHDGTDKQTGIEVGKMTQAAIGCGTLQYQTVDQVEHHPLHHGIQVGHLQVKS